MYYMFLAPGFEETEAIVPLDLLRRARVEVKTAALFDTRVTGSHGISFIADMRAEEIDLALCDGVILPGGPGYVHLHESEILKDALAAASAKGGLLAAICAAPSVLGRQGYLNGRRACCFPGFEAALLGAEIVTEPSVRDANIVTSRGAGTAFEFAFAILGDKADGIAHEIQFKGRL